MQTPVLVYVYFNQYSWEKGGTFSVHSVKLEDTEHRTFVCEQTINIEVPEDYDPRAQKIAALKAHKERVMAEYNNTVNQINKRISELQAIEYAA